MAYQWIFQFLFGRYRPWGELRWEHFIVLGAFTFITVIVYFLLLKRRIDNNDQLRRKIPRSALPLSKTDMSRKRYEELTHEMLRVKTISQDLTIVPAHPGEGDLGWGYQEDVADVHFNTSIGKSYYVLEDSALQRRPHLRHRYYRTVRDYVAALQREFPRLPADLCTEYVYTYERARFDTVRFTYPQYDHFMRLTFAMVAIITERADKTDKRESSRFGADNPIFVG